jgi:hypothetical protein
MKTLAWWAIGSGLFFGALTFAVPSILRWQAEHTLRGFDAVRFVPELVEAQMEDLRVGLLVTQVMSGVSIAGGYLILHRKRAGFVMWASVCVLTLVFCAVDFTVRGAAALPATAIRATWWSTVLIVSWSTFRKPEHASWWS